MQSNDEEFFFGSPQKRANRGRVEIGESAEKMTLESTPDRLLMGDDSTPLYTKINGTPSDFQDDTSLSGEALSHHQSQEDFHRDVYASSESDCPYQMVPNVPLRMKPAQKPMKKKPSLNQDQFSSLFSNSLILEKKSQSDPQLAKQISDYK